MSWVGGTDMIQSGPTTGRDITILKAFPVEKKGPSPILSSQPSPGRQAPTTPGFENQ